LLQGAEEISTEAFEPIAFELLSSTQSATMILGDEYRVFTHPERKFSIEYPKELVVQGYKETDGAETILFQREGDDLDISPDEKLGFQIFISPFGEDERLTKERILKDLPGTIIENPQEVILGRGVGGDDINALLFWSDGSVIGRTREAWFVHKEFLYEFTAYAHLDIWLAKILSTLRFE